MVTMLYTTWHLFHNWKFVPLNHLHHLVYSPTPPLAAGHPSVFLFLLLGFLGRFIFSFFKISHVSEVCDICLSLTYFTWHNALKIHPWCHKWRVFLLYGWIIFHCIHIPHFVSLFFCHWTLRLFPCLGNCR